MAFIPTSNCVKATVLYSGFPKQQVNVFHFATAGAPTHTDFAEIADFLEDVYVEAWESLASNQVGVSGFEMRDMSVDDGIVDVIAPSTTIQGIASIPIPEVNVAYVLSWRTGLAGRSQRGRTYLPGWELDKVNGSTIASGGITALQAFGDALIAAASGAGHALQVVSFRHNNAFRTTGQKTPVTSCVVNTNVGTQRRRVL